MSKIGGVGDPASTDGARLAAALAIGYVVFFVGGMFYHYLVSGDEGTLRYSLARPGTWIAAIGGVLIGYGLWRRYAWAWWAGLAGAVLQMLGVSLAMARFFSHGDWPPVPMLVIAGLLVTFTWLLLQPGTRAACIH